MTGMWKTNHTSLQCRSKTRLRCGWRQVTGQLKNLYEKTKQPLGAVESVAEIVTEISFTTPVNQKIISYANTTNDTNDKLLIKCGATRHIVSNSNYFMTNDTRFNWKQHFIQLADGHRSNELATARGDAQFKIADTEGGVT